MYENFFTTKMSNGGKVLQNRFTKIRSKIGKRSKIASLIVAIFLILALLGGTVVMALVHHKTGTEIGVFYENRALNFEHKPFFRHNTVYLPLFELADAVGISEKTEFIQENGNISIFIEGHYNSYQIAVGSNTILYRFPQHDSETLTPYAPVEKRGTVYIPFDYIDWIFNRYNDSYGVYFTYGDIQSNVPYLDNIEGMTYPYICDLQYQTDNGHYPWRLKPELVVTAALGEGQVYILEETKARCQALYTTEHKQYEVTLIKPVQKDEFGIWIVHSFKETEEN